MTKVVLNYPAAIPVGHRVELTWFEDTRPERQRHKVSWYEPYSRPVVKDLETGIVYMNYVHASNGVNGGHGYTPKDYPFGYRQELPVREVWVAKVLACTLVFVEALESRHTQLLLEPYTEGGAGPS
ncbi:MAG: hypothetical protein ACTH9H_11755 [Galactobacter sp.]